MPARRFRTGAVPGWGTALVACLGGLPVAGGLAGGAAVAGADPSSPVALVATVHAPDGSSSTDSLTVADLQSCPVYGGPSEIVEHDGDGRAVTVDLPSAQPGTSEGTWNLGAVLGCLATPIPLTDVQSVAVIGGDGRPESAADSLLVPSSGDFDAPSDFATSDEVPTLSDRGSTLEYDRPARSSGDPDFTDQTSEPVGTPIAVEVYEGRAPLRVSITSPSGGGTTVAPGTVVSLAASVSGGRGDAGSDGYVWDFGGGASPGSSTSAAPSVRFGTPGVYRVRLQVSDGAGDVGQAPPVTVTVSGGPAASKTSTGAAPPGPTRSGEPAGSSGPIGSARPASPSRGPGSARPSHGLGSGGDGSPARARGVPARGRARAREVPAPGAASPGAASSGSASSAAPTGTASSAAPGPTAVRPDGLRSNSTAARPPALRPRRVALRTGAPAGTRVVGLRIAAPTPVPLASLRATPSPEGPRAVGAAPASRADSGAGGSLGLGVAAALGLLGLGAWGESRPRRSGPRGL